MQISELDLSAVLDNLVMPCYYFDIERFEVK